MAICVPRVNGTPQQFIFCSAKQLYIIRLSKVNVWEASAGRNDIYNKGVHIIKGIQMRKEERQRQLFVRLVTAFLILVASIMIIVTIVTVQKNKTIEEEKQTEVTVTKYVADQPELDVELLTVNEYSRPGAALEQVNGIVVHYTANPGTTAIQNRSYFENLAETHETKASSHFVIGLDGEIVQCIPCNEISYASNDRNSDTISIECCIEDETGKFNGNTYESLIKLTTWLMGRYDLSVDDVIRHYDVTGKDCPKYYVEHEDAWEQFKQDLLDYIEENGIEKEE